MSLPLGALGRASAVSLVLGLSLVTLFGEQSTSKAAVPGTGAVRFPVEEATIAGIHAAYLRGQTTAHGVTQSYLVALRPTTSAGRI